MGDWLTEGQDAARLRRLQADATNDSTFRPAGPMSDPDRSRARRLLRRIMKFRQLSALAQQVVTATQQRLPRAVRAPACQVPVCFEAVPNEDILAEGWEPDILGLFVGTPHDADPGAPDPLPPQILLFLDNIWDYAEGDPDIFRDEVRITYLHELGHYLGWDEIDLEARGLD
jgi:predicted Zn-dependent protease with MMP-like domain